MHSVGRGSSDKDVKDTSPTDILAAGSYHLGLSACQNDDSGEIQL